MSEVVWPGIGFLEAYVSYFFVSMVAAFVAWIFLRHRYPKEALRVYLFFLLFNQAMPIVGVVFTVWTVWFLLHVKYHNEIHVAEVINIEEFSLSFPQVHRIFGEGAMLMLFKENSISSRMKIRALASLANELSRKHLEIIKLALADRDDEVRLFCFSVVDKLEKRINEQIAAELKRFEGGQTQRERAEAASHLADLYWDLVYFALSDEVLEKFMAEESKKFILYSLKYDFANVQMHILLGKVFLYEGDYEKAAQEFVLAIELKEDDNAFITPYLAEIYYNRRNFISVKSLLTKDPKIVLNPKLYYISLMWGSHEIPTQ
ncbi:hypothetical protein [Hydrogenimonas sp.]